MGKTTRQTQAAAQKRVAGIQPNQPSGRTAPPPAPNQFLGGPERVPQLVYVADFPKDKFLGEAREYYQFFGLEMKPVKSVHEIVIDLGTRQGVLQRIAIVSHAHPRGMLLPMFTGAVKGTSKELFAALAKSDYDGLVLMSPFDERTAHLFSWSSKLPTLMKAARTKNAAALKPLGLDKTGTPPAGDLTEFFFHCFDIVVVKANIVKQKGELLSAADRKTVLTFVDEILNQLTLRLAGKPINGRAVTEEEWKTLRASLTGIPFDDFNLTIDFDLKLEPDSMNFFPSLAKFVKAVKGGLRAQMDAARLHLDATSRVDVRGCRVGKEAEYLTAIGAFLGRPNAVPTVTGPQHFQAYAPLFFDTLRSRKDIAAWLGKERHLHSPQKLRELLTSWADMIRVRPLHTDFWTGLLEGPAVRLLALTEKDIPKLFVPAPGLKDLVDPDVKKSVGALASFFNVEKTEVPVAAQIKALGTAAPGVRAAAVSLLASVPDSLGGDRLRQLYEKLRDLDQAEGQTIVPDTAPASIRAEDVRGWQRQLLEHFDTGPLAPLKKTMTAAANSLKNDDGLYYYLFQAGLPVFVFGRPEAAKNAIVVYTPHQKVLQQSWYQCLWKDPLPDKGQYKKAGISAKLAHTLPMLVDENDRSAITSVCPLPRYALCMRARPLPAGESDSECDSLSNP